MRGKWIGWGCSDEFVETETEKMSGQKKKGGVDRERKWTVENAGRNRCARKKRRQRFQG